MDVLTLILSERQPWDSNSKGMRNIWRGTELPGIGVRTMGVGGFSQTEELADAIVPLTIPPSQSWQVCTVSEFHLPV